MTINANTKIAAILKHKPDALEAIIGISSKFQKLRNPFHPISRFNPLNPGMHGVYLMQVIRLCL